MTGSARKLSAAALAGRTLIVGAVVGLVMLASAQTPSDRDQSKGVVYIGGGLGYEELVVFTSSLAASGRPAVVLLDSPQMSKANQEFLKAFQPERVIPVGSFPDGLADLEKRLTTKTAPALEWARGPPTALWTELFTQASRVVVSPAEPRRLLLQSACLAGVLNAPLYVSHAGSGADLRRWLADWKTREVFAVAAAADLCRDLPDITVTPLADEKAVRAAYRTEQFRKGRIDTIVVANPADGRQGMSALAPWLALERRGLLLLTNDKGDNCAALVQAALKEDERIHADYLILAGSLEAIPMETRPNPVPGKDAEIEMEPLTPTGEAPFTFATGRLFHEEPGIVALIMARRQLLRSPTPARKALIVSNPGNSLPLLETFSRHTDSEFRNRGYQTTALFGNEVSRAKVRRLMPEQDIFLWEGHYKTLIEEYEFLEWTEPLRPSLIFLQSCLALNEEESGPLFERGAVAVVGSSTRTYSATGGAFTLAFFDALLYDDLTLGAGLRQAKNFLLAYSLLKQKRLNGEAKLAGVNLRSAWAFTLWGDPTLRLPHPERPTDALAGVRHEVKGDTLVVHMPDAEYKPVVVGKYEARMRPNARLAGLLTTPAENAERRRLVPFVFAEVKLDSRGKVPRLRTSIPEKQWVFLWDAQRSCGHLLITPRGKSQQQLRFKITWEDTQK